MRNKITVHIALYCLLAAANTVVASEKPEINSTMIPTIAINNKLSLPSIKNFPSSSSSSEESRFGKETKKNVSRERSSASHSSSSSSSDKEKKPSYKNEGLLCVTK